MPRLRRSAAPSAPAGAARSRLVGTLARLHRELLEQLPLPRGLSRVGTAHVDQHVEVAAHARPPQVRHAPAAQPDLGARLGAGLDLDQLLAVGRGHRRRARPAPPG